MAVGDPDADNQQIIAEFRVRHGVVGGALADSSMLLLHTDREIPVVVLDLIDRLDAGSEL